MLAAFDFATPDQHAPLRYTTTVPQQALFLLNSSFLAEQAKHLVERPELAAEKEPAHRVALLYRLVLGRDATAREIEAGTRFLSSETDPTTTATEQSAWQYGSGEYDRVTDRTMSFSPFKAFTGDFWQGSSMLPDAVSGKAKLGAEAGEPGDTPQQAVIRRWTSAVEGKLAIEITLRHDQNSLGTQATACALASYRAVRVKWPPGL